VHFNFPLIWHCIGVYTSRRHNYQRNVDTRCCLESNIKGGRYTLSRWAVPITDHPCNNGMHSCHACCINGINSCNGCAFPNIHTCTRHTPTTPHAHSRASTTHPVFFWQRDNLSNICDIFINHVFALLHIILQCYVSVT
jgi:hypothetical protein